MENAPKTGGWNQSYVYLTVGFDYKKTAFQ